MMSSVNVNGTVGNVSIECIHPNNQQSDMVFRTGATTQTDFGTERMRIDTNGNVGIGTTAPTAYGSTTTLAINNATWGGRLDLMFAGVVKCSFSVNTSLNTVIESAQSTTHGYDLQLVSGQAAAGTDLDGGDVFVSGGASTGTGASAIYLQTATPGATGTGSNAATTKVIITGAGNVGIGTTSPGAKLDVKSSGISTWAIRALASDSGSLGGIYEGADTSADFYLYKADGSTIGVRLNSVGDCYLNTGGNVGIGTAAPGALLHINNDSGAATYERLLQGRSSVNNSFGLGAGGNDIYFGAAGGGGLHFAVNSDLGVTGASVPTNVVMTINSSGTVTIQNMANNASETQFVVWNSSTKALEYRAGGANGSSGSAGASGSSGTSGVNGANGSSGSAGASGSSGTSGVNGANGSSGSAGASGTSGTSGVNGANGSSGSAGASGTSGVNGANGSSGSAGASGTSGTSGVNGANGSSGSAGASGTSGTSGVNGANGSSGSAGASGTSGTSGSDGSASDARVKKNVREFKDGLNVIENLNTVEYEYNGLGGTTDGQRGISLIAQEANQFIPYCFEKQSVKLNKDDTEDTEIFIIHGDRMSWPLVNATKELSAQNKALEQRVISLENQISDIRRFIGLL
jgi:hypothetical protein